MTTTHRVFHVRGNLICLTRNESCPCDALVGGEHGVCPPAIWCSSPPAVAFASPLSWSFFFGLRIPEALVTFFLNLTDVLGVLFAVGHPETRSPMSLADHALFRELPMVPGHNQGRIVGRIRAQR
jgi:hypothetical protein